MKKVYLAGFDVFYPDARDRGAKMKEQCLAMGLEGLYPLDNEAKGADNIFCANVAQIDRADAICANVNAFRGAEPDSGTCFEIGYAYAKGLPVFLYRADLRTMREVLGEWDEDGMHVENCNMAVNLMLGCAMENIVTDFESSLAEIKRFFEKPLDK